jgi:hypothetical protein
MCLAERVSGSGAPSQTESSTSKEGEGVDEDGDEDDTCRAGLEEWACEHYVRSFLFTLSDQP